MSRLPQVSGKETIRALTKVGFVKVSQKGSHIKLVRISGKNKVTLTVPDHKILKKGTLRNGILKVIPLTVEEFLKLLKK